MEIIKVQAADRRASEACLNYLRALEQQIKKKKTTDISIYTHAAFQEHLMISLKWGTPIPNRPGSRLSSLLVQELKQFGLVDLSTWKS
ncbi:hypothetical protein [Desulfocicer vacuolatum]|nr:hypothetical protein [Desulfocicer vacuolatum]